MLIRRTASFPQQNLSCFLYDSLFKTGIVRNAASPMTQILSTFSRSPGFMKMKLAVVALFALVLSVLGCSTSGSKTSNINGNWTASLTDTHGNQVLAFNTTITESSNSSLSVSNFSFSTNSECFVSGERESGTFALSGDFNGNVAGKFGMNVISGSPGGNNLTLTGTVNGNTITGTWSLTGGPSCTGNGTFTMTRM
jgi:hypothetical protein